MKLRQKLFAAIAAVMAIVFMMFVLVQILHGLESQASRRTLAERLRKGAEDAFAAAVAEPSEQAWRRLTRTMGSLGFTDWCVKNPDGGLVAGAGDNDFVGARPVASSSGYEFFVAEFPEVIEPIRWLSGAFWVVLAGTLLLLVVVYGLIMRLVLRPVEDLVEASKSLSAGAKPRKVPGEHRTDEIGALVAAFNKMAEEVTASRQDLERKVSEAMCERERTLKRLALEQRLSATGTLAAGMAHEIANPLGGMLNAARTLAQEQGLSERGKKYVQLIQEGIERIARLVDRIRTFVRPKPSVGLVHLDAIAKEAIELARHRLEKENVSLAEELTPEVTVMGDPGELQQVVLNLVLNALDAMRGSAEKRLTVKTLRDGNTAVLEVSDTGCGMSQEELSRAFDLFYTTKESGTGLGLAIAHKLITDHGGEIELSSKPGTGTIARVKLPAAEKKT